MRRFNTLVLLSTGALFLVFLLVEQFFFCPKIEMLYFGCSAFACFVLGYTIFSRRWIQPLEQMIEAVKPYNEGKILFIPKFISVESGRKNEFTALATALNVLTERLHKQMERIEKKDKEMESILESLNEGVIALDMKEQVIFANQAACRILSCPKEELMTKARREKNRLMQKCHEMILHSLQTSENIVESWKKEDVCLDLIVSPLMHQEGITLVLQDKTSDYKIVEMGKTFIANASHELRTPITVIRGFAEMLQNDAKIPLPTKMEITSKIVRTCDRFDKLVKSLLTIADLENISPERFRYCDLVPVLEHCKHLLLAAHPKTHIGVDNPYPEIFLLADPDLLDLALMNLLENAVKYSSEPAEIRVTVEKNGASIVICIADQGIGIPPDDLPHIFDRFYTVDKARSRKSGGAGLGLSIVKTIIEKHKGCIQVSSKPGVGSCFKVIIPIFI